MDLAIYVAVCRVRGHNIVHFAEDLLNPKTNQSVQSTKLICTQCGGEGTELQSAQKPPRRTRKPQENPPENGG
jgi:hypothetical protein